MSSFDGNDGIVKVGSNTVAEVIDWNITETAQTKDDTVMGDAWTTKKSGVKSWSGSLNMQWDDTDTTGQGAMTVGAEVTLNLYPEGDTTGDYEYSGSAIVTSVGAVVSKDGIVQRPITFEGNGALTHGTAS